MADERELLHAFEGSQRRRNTIAAIVTALALGGFFALKLYQSHLRAEASRPMEITGSRR